jgi:DNA-binding transcriptional ArsR family regulator
MAISEAIARVAPPLHGPWNRETRRLVARISEYGDETGPLESLVIEEPGGCGADRLIENAFAECHRMRPGGLAVALAPARMDAVYDWPSFAIEIFLAADRCGAPHGMPAAEIVRLRSGLGDALFRDELDQKLRAALGRHGPLVVFVSRLDLVLAPLEQSQDDWAIRNVLQNHPLALIGSSPARWRPHRELAFFEFFDRIRMSGYTDTELDALAKSCGLTGNTKAIFKAVAVELKRRPALVEAAASVLATAPDTDIDAVLRMVAAEAAFLAVDLAGLAAQARRALVALAQGPRPAALTSLNESSDLSRPALSALLGRLVETGIVRVDPAIGRNRSYDFGDPVWGTLFSALVHGTKSAAELAGAAVA